MAGTSLEEPAVWAGAADSCCQQPAIAVLQLQDLPALEQTVPLVGITATGILQCQHPIRAEMPEVAAHFAPRREKTQLRHEGHRKRPDHPLTGPPFGIAVLDAYGIAFADCTPQCR